MTRDEMKQELKAIRSQRIRDINTAEQAYERDKQKLLAYDLEMFKSVYTEIRKEERERDEL